MRFNGVPIIDLFSGAGGLSIGAANAGGDVRVCVEIDPNACETLRSNKNHKNTIILQEDVRNLTGQALRKIAGLSAHDPVIVIGGPPCQPFSKAAYWTDSGDEARYRRARTKGLVLERPKQSTLPKPDCRRSLVDDFFRLVIELKADGFLFENVPSILHPRNKATFDELHSNFQKHGYGTTLVLPNAIDYGVAQKRKRIVLLGVKGGIPRHPVATHSNEKVHGKMPVVTAGEVLRQFKARRFAEPEEVVIGRWATQLHEVPPGWNYKALTAWAGHPKPVFEAETRFWSFLLKLSPEHPSWTIAANPGPWVGPFHWESRRLRTVELAALQSFPADYKFAGKRRDRVRQIGNAVPPLLAERMVTPLIEDVQDKRARR